MRTTHAVLALVLTMSFVVSVEAAQVVTEEPAAVTTRDVQQSGRPKMLVVSVQDIELTEEQEARIAAIRKEYGDKIKEDAKELKTLAAQQLDRIRNVFTPEQRAKIQDIIAQKKEFKEECLAHAIANLKELDLTEAELAKIREIRNAYRPKMDEAIKQLDGLLTEDQKKA